MIVEFDATCAIVLYKNDPEILKRAIESFLSTDLKVKLFLIDNSPESDLKQLSSDARIEYFHNPSNPGFGAAHNIAIDLAIKAGLKYHFVINPDIYFDTDVVLSMFNYMDANQDIGMMMPEVLYFDGSVQYLPKLLPNPFWIFRRKFGKGIIGFSKFIEKYELRHVPRKKTYNTPILSGCFTLLNLKAIEEVGSYDDKFFMYFEDFDLSRRMHQKYKTIYFPEVSVYHGYEGGANKSFKLFKIFLSSAIHYFNKWGWLYDKERKLINNRALSQIEA
jgi:GT2 family glycosyltransferase